MTYAVAGQGLGFRVQGMTYCMAGQDLGNNQTPNPKS
jgi:hypothetical protein